MSGAARDFIEYPRVSLSRIGIHGFVFSRKDRIAKNLLRFLLRDVILKRCLRAISLWSNSVVYLKLSSYFFAKLYSWR